MRAWSVGSQSLQLGGRQTHIGTLPHDTAEGRSLFAAHHDSASGRKRRAFRSVVETCLNLAMFTESYAEYLFHREYVLKAEACMPPESVKG